MTPVRLEPAAIRSRVKHSTTEPLRSDIVMIFFSYSGPSGILGSDGKQNTAKGHENCCTFHISHEQTQ